MHHVRLTTASREHVSTRAVLQKYRKGTRTAPGASPAAPLAATSACAAHAAQGMAVNLHRPEHELLKNCGRTCTAPEQISGRARQKPYATT
eukprot:6193064-Pleurochrysis_carterae.AAC.1